MNQNEAVNQEEIDNKSVSSENSQELFNLIQSIQTKLNTEEISKDSKIKTKNQNDAETNTFIDEKVNPIVSKETTTNKNQNTINNSGSDNDFSNLASLLQNIDLSSIMNIFTNNNTAAKQNDNAESNSIFNGFDASTILKFQRILSSMNKNDPKKNLLLSLKPFLRKSRQDKLNEYVTMLTIANAIEIFGSKGSDE